jgi:hypothetical protein
LLASLVHRCTWGGGGGVSVYVCVAHMACVAHIEAYVQLTIYPPF